MKKQIYYKQKRPSPICTNTPSRSEEQIKFHRAADFKAKTPYKMGHNLFQTSPNLEVKTLSPYQQKKLNKALDLETKRMTHWDTELICDLVQKGANVLLRGDETTPLHRAIMNGRLDIVYIMTESPSYDPKNFEDSGSGYKSTLDRSLTFPYYSSYDEDLDSKLRMYQTNLNIGFKDFAGRCSYPHIANFFDFKLNKTTHNFESLFNSSMFMFLKTLEATKSSTPPSKINYQK